MDGAQGGRAKAWAVLPVLEQLSEPDTALTSEDVAHLLGTRVNGIASTLRPSKEQLENLGIRFEEAVSRRKRRGRSTWRAGARISQARHLLRLVRQGTRESGWGDDVPLEDVAPDDPRPTLVVRTLARRGRGVEFHSLAELESLTDDTTLDMRRDSRAFEFPEEVLIERIEP